MAITVNLVPKMQRQAGRHYVYAKAKWSQPWTLMPWLWADEISWRLAPAHGAASLSWRFGIGMRQGETKVGRIAPLDGQRRLYIKIAIVGHQATGTAEQADVVSHYWYGTCEIDARTMQGIQWLQNSPSEFPAGMQALECLDLAHTLYRRQIRRTCWLGQDGSVNFSGRAGTFNRPNPAGVICGNRSANKAATSYVFSSKIADDDKFWTTRTAVQYLVANEQPTGANGIAEFSLLMDHEAELLLADWDKPVLTMHNQSTGQVLDQLMPRSRMLSWRLRVDDLDGEEVPRIVPISLLDSDVTTDLGMLARNRRQLNLQTTRATDGSPDIVYSLRESDLAQIDQVRARGAPRTSTGTLANADDTIDKGWTDALKDQYNEAASARAGYDDLSTAERQLLNTDVRESDRLASVFRRFAIPGDWNGKVKDGLGAGGEKPFFLEKDDDANKAHVVNPRELWLAPTLALQEGLDYTDLGTPSEPKPPAVIATQARARTPALVIFKDPTTAGVFFDTPRYVLVEKIGLAANTEEESGDANFKWSGRVEVPDEDRAVLIHVQGQPQHVLAADEFVRLDEDEFAGKWDWKDALFTVTLLDDRDAEGVWPPDSQVDPGLVNLKRELLVYAGDAYRQDWMVPNTVIGVKNDTGELLRCANGGWINNHTKILRARAQTIWSYYRKTRRALTLETSHVTDAIQLGDLVLTIGHDNSAAGQDATITPREVGSIVSEIVLTIPGGQRPAAPTIRYVTAFAELEPNELLNRGPRG